MGKARRCRHEIAADVLEYLASAGYARISWIATHANMPVDRALQLLEEMRRRGLVESIEGEKGVYYRVGARGYEYLELWRRLRVLLG